MKVLVLLMAMTGAAMAHDAPSGWTYPPYCCHGDDCRPVGCGVLHEVEGGIEWLGVVFPKQAIHRSEDGYCHVCVGTYGPGMDHRVGHCVFMTPRT